MSTSHRITTTWRSPPGGRGWARRREPHANLAALRRHELGASAVQVEEAGGQLGDREVAAADSVPWVH
jgi:hypothetical protein